MLPRSPGATPAWSDAAHRGRLRTWLAWTIVLTLVFAPSLVGLIRHALQSDLHSYIPLIPVVAGYLLYLRRGSLGTTDRRSIGGAATLVLASAIAFGTRIVWRDTLSVNDAFTLIALAYVALIAAGGFLFLGSRWMASAAFPMAFLVFLAPLPDAAVYWLERGSVLASAEVSAAFFHLTGTPLLRDGTVFTLPGIVVQVAQECSGIRSSWVLFITSLVAANLFLTNHWHRAILVLFIIPLAIVRNAFRILVIGLLCVHIGPHMIDSVIHHRGGPLFFALSLGPLFLLLIWLRRRER